MRIGRLVGIVLLGGVLGVAVWLIVRGSELPPTNAKPPPSFLEPKRGLRPLSLAPRVDSGEAVPPIPEVGSPDLIRGPKGQLLMELLAGAGSVNQPSAAAIELYLQQHRRGAAGLLTVWQTSGDINYLKEAATRFQDDPQVQFAVLASDAFPEDRAKWIGLFKQWAPLNPLGNYFAAHEYFRQNQTDQAVAELAAASGKQRIDDYTATSFQERQELFVTAGVSSPIEAKGNVFAVGSSVLQSYLETMKALGQEMAGAQAAYAAADDTASAQRLAQSGIALGEQMNAGSSGRLLKTQLAGLEIEQMILKQLPPDEPVDWLGQSPATRLANLQQQQEQMQTLSTASSSALPSLDDTALDAYVDQVIQSGELEAMKWLASRAPVRSQATSPN